MTDELKALIDDAIFCCEERGGLSTSVCMIDGAECSEKVNNGNCPMLSRLFGEEQENE